MRKDGDGDKDGEIEADFDRRKEVSRKKAARLRVITSIASGPRMDPARMRRALCSRSGAKTAEVDAVWSVSVDALAHYASIASM